MENKTLVIMLAVLAVLLILVIGYIIVDKYIEARESQLLESYQEGIRDTLIALHQQTENCQVTTSKIGNLTRQIIDVNCVK